MSNNKKILVFTATYNERDNIETLILEMQSQIRNTEYQNYLDAFWLPVP